MALQLMEDVPVIMTTHNIQEIPLLLVLKAMSTFHMQLESLAKSYNYLIPKDSPTRL